jgi:hypothetical protein
LRRTREMCNAGATMPTTPAVTLKGSPISVKDEEVSCQAGEAGLVSFLHRALSAGSPDHQSQLKAGDCASCPSSPTCPMQWSRFYQTDGICGISNLVLGFWSGLGMARCLARCSYVYDALEMLSRDHHQCLSEDNLLINVWRSSREIDHGRSTRLPLQYGVDW